MELLGDEGDQRLVGASVYGRSAEGDLDGAGMRSGYGIFLRAGVDAHR